eukprot:TRINITY_DN26292_c0_g1_i1.p1 TRINITY_DN26292_c0_g1~~TRINITY_DN26292_c0_g1_i1.p1  ORF type:complete len:266 (+),score=55.04 TRINITY_DN26292_c0_g1_i1:49-798(+)
MAAAAVVGAHTSWAEGVGAPQGRHVFARSLPRRPWTTLDLAAGAAAGPYHTSSASAPGARAAAAGILRRGLLAAGASDTEAQTWASELEAAAWDATSLEDLSGTAAEGASVEAAPRRYRAELRRLGAATKSATVAADLIARLRSGAIDARGVLALPAEELLPEAQRARLKELRTAGPLEELDVRRYDYEDPSLACAECGRTGCVKYMHLSSSREGYAKAETWGSKENDAKGERCQAQCSECLAEWVFEQ